MQVSRRKNRKCAQELTNTQLFYCRKMTLHVMNTEKNLFLVEIDQFHEVLVVKLFHQDPDPE
jgi:hypothetical protein